MQAKPYFIKTLVSFGVFTLFLLFVAPSKVPVLVLFVPYVLLGLTAYFLWMSVGVRIYRTRPEKKLQVRTAALVFAALVVICAGLSSLGEITLRDFVVALLLGVGSYFYATRMLLTK